MARRSAARLSGPRDLARIASEGEAIGYDYCTISDHVVIPRELEAKYPYSDTGEFPGRAGGDRHEQLTAVTFVAGQDLEIAARHLGHGRAAPPGGADRQDPGDDRRAVRRAASPWASAPAGAARSSRRSAPTRSTSAAPSPTRYLLACRELWTNENPQLRRQIRQVLQHLLRAAPGAEADADLGRRRERPGAAPHRQARRRLVSDRHQPGNSGSTRWRASSAASSGCAGIAATPAATRRRSRSPTASPQCGTAIPENAPITATGGSFSGDNDGDRRRSAGVTRSRRRRGRFQLRRRHCRRGHRQYAALPRGRAGQGLNCHNEREALRLRRAAEARVDRESRGSPRAHSAQCLRL